MKAILSFLSVHQTREIIKREKDWVNRVIGHGLSPAPSFSFVEAKVRPFKESTRRPRFL
jgi:hypothetical protein